MLHSLLLSLRPTAGHLGTRKRRALYFSRFAGGTPRLSGDDYIADEHVNNCMTMTLLSNYSAQIILFISKPKSQLVGAKSEIVRRYDV